MFHVDYCTHQCGTLGKYRLPRRSARATNFAAMKSNSSVAGTLRNQSSMGNFSISSSACNVMCLFLWPLKWCQSHNSFSVSPSCCKHIRQAAITCNMPFCRRPASHSCRGHSIGSCCRLRGSCSECSDNRCGSTLPLLQACPTS